MKKKLLTVMAIIMVMALVFTACTTASNPTEESPAPDETKQDQENNVTTEADLEQADEEFTMLVLPKMIGIPIFDAFEAGAIQAAEDFGINVIYTGPTAADAVEQVKILEDYINKGIDCVAVAPNDPAAFSPVLQKAREAGITIVDWDSYAEEGLADLSCRQLDDAEFGQAIWDGLVEAMGTDEGDYAIITGGLSAENLNSWINAGMEYAKEKYPNLNLVTDIIASDEKQQMAYTKALELIKSYPDLKGIIGISTPAPIGAAQAVQEKGLQDKIAVVGTVVPNDAGPFIEDGSLDSGYLYDPTGFMYATCYLAWQVSLGNEIKDQMEIPNLDQKVTVSEDGKNVTFAPPLRFTKDNINDYDF